MPSVQGLQAGGMTPGLLLEVPSLTSRESDSAERGPETSSEAPASRTSDSKPVPGSGGARQRVEWRRVRAGTPAELVHARLMGCFVCFQSSPAPLFTEALDGVGQRARVGQRGVELDERAPAHERDRD